MRAPLKRGTRAKMLTPVTTLASYFTYLTYAA